MKANKVLKSFHLPVWMDEELRMLSFATKLNKAELVRRFINAGLENSWEELNNRINTQSYSVEVPEGKSDVSEEAKKALRANA